jgi:LexA DNA binding domain
VATRRARVDADLVSRQVSGKSVSHLEWPDDGRLAIHFTDGSGLVVERRGASLAITPVPATLTADTVAGGIQPTARQREYLDFIAQYIRRFGRSPAESDIQRRFLVSAPAVNQMVQTLERRGFITRQTGVPRSIRVVDRPHRPLSA